MLLDHELYDRKVRSLNYETRELRHKYALLESTFPVHSENEQAQRVLNDTLRSHNEALKNEIKVLKSRLDDSNYERNRKESYFEFVIRRMEEELEEKGNQYAKLEGKILPLLDSDAVRLRVLNEVEYPHRLELYEKEAIIERLQEEIVDYRRQIEMLRCQLETNQLYHERAMRELKSKHKNELNNALLDLHTYEALYHTRKSSGKMYASLRKDLDYYRSRYFHTEKYLTALKNTLEQLKHDSFQRSNQQAYYAARLQHELDELKR